MNARRFELLVRSLHAAPAAAGSRRRLLAAALAALVLGAAGSADAHDMRERCRKLDNPRKRRRCIRKAKDHDHDHDPDPDPDPGIPCDPPCPAGARCLHGACTCDPFDNRCPTEVDGQCGCGAVVSAAGFEAACVDRNSACDLDKPCDDHDDCPAGSVCLLGCADPGNPLGTNRCSTPCVAA